MCSEKRNGRFVLAERARSLWSVGISLRRGKKSVRKMNGIKITQKEMFQLSKHGVWQWSHIENCCENWSLEMLFRNEEMLSRKGRHEKRNVIRCRKWRICLAFGTTFVFEARKGVYLDSNRALRQKNNNDLVLFTEFQWAIELHWISVDFKPLSHEFN